MPENNIQVSIIIVTYKVKSFLTRCLDSLADAQKPVSSEIIIVDNDSNDGTYEYIKENHSQIQMICNKKNLGFGRACNQGIEKAKGKYILFLNPDTIVQTSTLTTLIDFLDNNPEAGIVGPKILNPDGKLQLACRRSFPTPGVALVRLLGLSILFPKSKWFGKYNLTYLDENKISEVDAVSGSCMMARKKTLDRAGCFDEEFFLYGEDLDLCHRVQSNGWKVFYLPDTQIVHFKGESARNRPMKSSMAFYEAMFLFSKKHITSRHSFLPGWLLYIGIFFNAFLGLFRLITSSLPVVLVDTIILNTVLFLSLIFWFSRIGRASPYSQGTQLVWLLHAGISFIWITVLGAAGAYKNRDKWIINSFRACAIATAVSLSMVYFVKQIAYSRAAFLLTSVTCIILFPSWRWLIDRIGAINWFLPRQRVLVAGTEEQINLAIRKLENIGYFEIVPYVTAKIENTDYTSEKFSVPLQIANAIRRNHIDEIIVFEHSLSYTTLIETIASLSKYKPSIRMASFSVEGNLLLANLGTSV